MPNDTHRRAVYLAEQHVRTAMERGADGVAYDFYGSMLMLPPERRFGTLESIQAFCDAVLALRQVKAQFPGITPVTVRKRRGASKAHYEPAGSIIAVPDASWAMRELVILHELAHHAARSQHRGIAAHGREFQDAFVFFTEEVIGPEAALLLRTGFAETIAA